MVSKLIEFLFGYREPEVPFKTKVEEEPKENPYGYFIVADDVDKFYIEKRTEPYSNNNARGYDLEVYGTRVDGEKITRHNNTIDFWDPACYRFFRLYRAYFSSPAHAKKVIDKYLKLDQEKIDRQNRRIDFLKAHPPERYP